jgi:hypothetical protein
VPVSNVVVVGTGISVLSIYLVSILFMESAITPRVVVPDMFITMDTVTFSILLALALVSLLYVIAEITFEKHWIVTNSYCALIC